MGHLPNNVPAYSEKPLRRFDHHIETGNPYRLSPYHRNVMAKRTLFLARVVSSDEPGQLLKSGHHARKIGSHVAKGEWRGLPIFTLSLEERATCPETCRHWLDCYGNRMNWSERITADEGLMPRLSSEIAELAREFRRGFVVRLHVLGDFFSVEYVEFWRALLDRHSAMNVFGYTAWQPDTEIGRAVHEARMDLGQRFAIRFSDGPKGYARTVSIATPEEAEDAIICPAQTGKSDCCGTCALCWATPKPIAFLEH